MFKDYFSILQNRDNTRRDGGLSAAYLNKHIQALTKFVQFLNLSGIYSINKPDLPMLDPDEKPIVVLTEKEIISLFASCDTSVYNTVDIFRARDKAMLVVFYSCGLRRNEGYHLDLGDFDFEKKVVHVRFGKMYKQRFVPFTTSSADILQHWANDCRPLMMKGIEKDAFFINEKGRRLSGTAMAIRLKIMQHKSDEISLQQKTIGIHLLRHSIASHLLKRGMSLEMIAKFLGHRSLDSTQRYTHLNDDPL